MGATGFVGVQMGLTSAYRAPIQEKVSVGKSRDLFVSLGGL
jgi:hypothetical protein